MRNLTLLAILLAGQIAFAKKLVEVHPSEVYPTQGVVGYQWVARKFEKFQAMTDKELKKALRDEPAPAVIGPGGRIFILDNHHEFYTLLELGYPVAYVDVIGDYSNMRWHDFARLIVRRGWIYTGDEHGQETFTFDTLPQSVAELRDDPYRALASFVRRAGGYEKVEATHVEFRWANYLRRLVPLRLIQSDLPRAIELGVHYALSSDAQDLPGFKGTRAKKNCESRLKNR